MTHLRRSIALVLAATSAVLFLLAGTAAAHVGPTVAAVPAGQRATVGFGIEHGCDDEPTTMVQIQAPDTVSDVAAVELDGWSSSIEGQVVTFEGGSQPAHDTLVVSISFIAPDDEGATLTFPVVQSCGDRTLDWIETGDDAERPAPTVLVGPAGAAPTTVATDDEEAGHEDGEDHDDGSSDEDATAQRAGEDETDDGSAAPIIIGGAVAVLIVGAGVIVYVTRSRGGE